ncbi:MAG: hypothetical protein AB7L36_11485, partial [Sphingomonadaceae bacterium]
NRHDVPDTPPIDVAIITPSELTRLRQGDPDSKEMVAKTEKPPEKEVSKKEAEKPKPVTAPPPPSAPPPPPEPEVAKPEPPPQPEPAKDPIADKIAALPPPPEPAPGPTPEELKKMEEEKQAAEEAKRKAEEQRKAEEARKEAEEAKRKALARKKDEERKKRLAEAKRKAEEAKKKQQFDPDRIAALLDKTPEKRGAPQQSNAPSPDTAYKGPTAGTRDGTDTELSAREQDLLRGLVRGQLRGCWHLPGGGGGSEIPVVTLRWRLKPDGTLDGVPQVEGGGGGPMYQIAVETAQRAVYQCAPFTLPPDKYASWKEIIWDFDPREML